MLRSLSLLALVLSLVGIPADVWTQTRAPAKAPSKAPAKPPAAQPQQKPPTPAPPAGPPLDVRATLERTTYSMANISSPAWTVKLTIKNNTPNELELGESLVVLEKVRESPQFAASYAARERAEPARHLERMKLRYALDFGFDVSPKGTYTMLFVAGGRMTLTMGSETPYPHLGYGRVAPRAARTIEVELPFPISAKAGMREYVALITPSIRALNAPASNAKRMILRFDPPEGSKESEFRPTQTETLGMTEPALRAIASDNTAEIWRRIFALNWLAEMYPESAAGLLTQFVADGNAVPLLRLVSTVNLGTWKMKEGVPSLLSALQETDNAELRRWIIDSLGDIGDPSAASAVRGYLTDSEDRLARTAMEAAGELKDPESVPILLAVLKDEKQSRRHDEAASALATIGNAESLTGLVSLLRHEDFSVQQLAAGKLGKTGAPEAVAPLAALADNAKTSQDIRSAALSSLGQIGGADALAVLRRAAESQDERTRGAAASSLGESKDPGALALLIELVEKSGYPSRVRVVEVLAQKEKKEALPSLRRLVADSQNPPEVRKEACEALQRMEDAEGVAVLVAAADDPSTPTEVRRAALSALGKIGGKPALEALNRAAEDNDEATRDTVLSALGEFQEPAAVTRLIELAERPGYLSRIKAIQTLRWKEKKEALTALRRIVADRQATSEVRREACGGLERMKDKGGIPALLTAATDEDERLYEDVLDALTAIGGPEALQAKLAALESRHPSVRQHAAAQLAQEKDAKPVGRLWPAYQRETEESAARNLAGALIDLGFQDRAAIAFLIQRLNPAANKLWYEDVRLLRHLSGQDFGPRYAWVDEKERDQELAKWREWWAQQPQQ